MDQLLSVPITLTKSCISAASGGSERAPSATKRANSSASAVWAACMASMTDGAAPVSWIQERRQERNSCTALRNMESRRSSSMQVTGASGGGGTEPAWAECERRSSALASLGGGDAAAAAAAA